MHIDWIQIPPSRADHLWRAHQVTPEEVYEAFEDDGLQIWRLVSPPPDDRPGSVYWAYGQASNGRLLAVLFRYYPDHNIYVITARNMDVREQRRYRR